MKAGCALAIAVLAAAACGKHAPPSAPSEKMGAKVSFVLANDEGAQVAIPIPGARATVLDFFAPTCKPCSERVPALVGKIDALNGAGAKLVLVAALGDGESVEDAARALDSWGVRAHFVIDKSGVAQHEAAVDSLPATLVLDAGGVLRWSAPASASADDVVAAVP